MESNILGQIYSNAPLDLSRRMIRVLQVEPEAAEGTSTLLSVKLRCIELDTTEYTCVSYTWGSDTHPDPILVK